MLADEQIGLTVIAVWKCKHSHADRNRLAVDLQLHIAPVKLTLLACGMVLPDIALLTFLRRLS